MIKTITDLINEMGVFNYSKFHYFDKNGNEIILKHNANIRIVVTNHDHDDMSAEYAFVNSEPGFTNIAGNSSLVQIKPGARFNLANDSCVLSTTTYIYDTSNGMQYEVQGGISNSDSSSYVLVEYRSSNGSENYPQLIYNDVSNTDRENFIDNLHIDGSINFFPTYFFDGKIDFDKVSTSLVETQTIYVLIEDEYDKDSDGRSKFIPVWEYAAKADSFDPSDFENFDSKVASYDASISSVKESLRDASVSSTEYVEKVTELQTLTSDKAEYINNYHAYLSYSDAKEYINRFKLVFFIDCREQKDFRFFRLDYDELTWSDRYIMNLDSSVVMIDASTRADISDNGYSVNIGFSGENDGVYEQKMYVCLIDSSLATGDDPGEVFQIGSLRMCAETEGEDERYRTLFTNFGIPDPKEYNEIFNDADPLEDLPDYISINKNSKKMFLAYPDIFPYVGSYKALINAVKLLGYENDVFFKEWYKEIGTAVSENGGYTTYDMPLDGTINRNVISNLEISERIHLKKMNWVSMVYRINNELDQADDQYGFPTAITNYKNFNADNIAKLFSLKKWIDKYILGVNCIITDISGEGMVFERYALKTFGGYQHVIDYNNEKAVSPVIKTTTVVNTGDGADILVDVHTGETLNTIGDYEYSRFSDFCEGYFDTNCIYHDERTSEDCSLYRYFGKTFELYDNINTFFIRAFGTHESFKLSSKSIDPKGADLIIDNNQMFFDSRLLCKRNESKNTYISSERGLPIIQIEQGIIKKYKNGLDSIGEFAYYAKIYKVESTSESYYAIDVTNYENTNQPEDSSFIVYDVPTFIPPTINSDSSIIPYYAKINGTENENFINPRNSTTYIPNYYNTNNSKQLNHFTTEGIRFCADDINGEMCIKIIGYEEKNISDNTNHQYQIPYIDKNSHEGDEYFVEILSGKIIFTRTSDDTYADTIIINFDYDKQTKNKHIYVTTETKSTQKSLYEYKIEENSYINRFTPNIQYVSFVHQYDINVDDIIIHNNTFSVNVKNVGEYSIDAVLYDEFNNIFETKSPTKVTVIQPPIDVSIWNKIANSGEPYKIDGIKVTDTNEVIDSPEFSKYGTYENFIFTYTPKHQISTRRDLLIQYNGLQKSFDVSTNDPGTNLINPKLTYHGVQFSSMSDRLFPIKIDSSFVYFAKFSQHGSHIFPESTNDVSTLIYNYSGKEKTKNICYDVSTLINDSSTDDITGTCADVTIYVYNDLYEYPLFSIPGVMLPLRAYPDSSYDGYVFKSFDNTLDASFFDYMPDTRHSFYAIPQWAVNCTFGNIDGRTNQFNITMDNYPFEQVFQKNSGVTIFNTTDAGDEFGAGLYNLRSMDTQNVSMYAYARKPLFADNVYQSSVDGSIWLSPSHFGYITYMADVSVDGSDTQKYYLNLIKNSKYNKCSPIVDNQFSLTFRDFDPNYATEMWIGLEVLNDPHVLFEYYAYNIPITTSYPEIILSKPTLNEDDKYTCIWKLYKRSKNNTRKLIFECTNHTSIFKLPEKGIYDIELEYFDMYGNKSTKSLISAITYV